MSEINAIATNNYLLATQQEVSHDNTLSGNGTVDSPLGVVPGYNETVLWDKGSGTALGNGTNTATLSEAMSNFEFVRFEAEWQVYASDSDRTYNFVCKVFRPNPVRFAIDSMCGYGSTTNTMYSAVSRFNINVSMTEVSFISKVCWLVTNASTGISLGPAITKIIGINRKA